MRVTQQQLVDILDNSDASSIIVVYEKPVKMNKTGNPFYVKEGRASVLQNDVTKRVVDSFGFGMNYVNMVNRRIRANGGEGNYQAKKVEWAEDVILHKVVRHKVTGQLYLIVFPTEGDMEIERVTEYYVDGEPATDEQMEIISKFEVKSSGIVKKQAEAGLTEYDQVPYNTIKFDNIISVVLDNHLYELK